MGAPPIGIIPRSIWQDESRRDADRKRAVGLAEAIVRYIEDDRPVPTEWAHELHELLTQDTNV